MKEFIKEEILMFISSTLLEISMIFTRFFYKIQCRLEQSSYPDNHNIKMEFGDVVIQKIEKFGFSRGALNNYTAQSVSITDYSSVDNSFIVSLDFPFNEKEKAYKAQSFLIDRFKKDDEIKKITDENINKLYI